MKTMSTYETILRIINPYVDISSRIVQYEPYVDPWNHTTQYKPDDDWGTGRRPKIFVMMSHISQQLLLLYPLDIIVLDNVTPA